MIHAASGAGQPGNLSQIVDIPSFIVISTKSTEVYNRTGAWILEERMIFAVCQPQENDDVFGIVDSQG